MASLTKEPNRDSWKLGWTESNKKRKSMRLGSMPKKTAEQFRVRFEELQGVRRGGGSLPQALSEWINCIDVVLRSKLESKGLVEPVKHTFLDKFFEEYKASRTGLADATITRDRQVCALLVEYFGADRDIGTISVRGAEEWTRWLSTEGNKRDLERKSLESNTVRRRTGTASQIFKTAIRWKLLTENPFVGLAKTVRENKERQVFVAWDKILKVIQVAPSQEWQALIAFARLCGPRVPSELHGLTWNDVDFVKREIKIKSPKTKHHGGSHTSRMCPMFMELVPYLEALFASLESGKRLPQSPVFPVVSSPRINLGTAFKRMIKAAGLEPWPKLFTNLRSSRETELFAEFSAADVCSWFGHSPAVAARFYAQSRPEEASRATRVSTVGNASSSKTVGAPAGAHESKMGVKAGALNDSQEDSSTYQDDPEHQEKEGVLRASEGVGRAADSIKKWTILDSNQRPTRCQRGALTN